MCPFTILRAYLLLRPDPPTGPLFLNHDGSIVTAKLLSHFLSSSLQAAGQRMEGITAHSLWIGATTTAAEQGASDSQLKLLGQWNSWAYNGYICPGAVGFRIHGCQSLSGGWGWGWLRCCVSHPRKSYIQYQPGKTIPASTVYQLTLFKPYIL